MELILTVVLLAIVIKLCSTNYNEDVETFVKSLADATRQRYIKEYALLRDSETSKDCLSAHLKLINPTTGFMNPFNHRQFKDGVFKAISASDKTLRAELCFIHDLMLEEYHQLLPYKPKGYEVGINEFYNLFRNHL